MDIEQKVVKGEIDMDNDFVWNMDVKQELSDEEPKAAFQNVDTNCIHLIKQEINDDLNTVQIFGECMVAAKTERDSSHRVNITNIPNKFKYLKGKPGRRANSKGLLKNGKHINPNTIAGIIICRFCGNLFTKQMEFLFHFSTNHYMKLKRLLYKTKFPQKYMSCRNIQITNINFLRNHDEDVKNEIEIVEHDLNAELQDIEVTDNYKLSIDEGQKLKRSDLNRHLCVQAGEKSFKCDNCLKSFSSSSNLNSHLRTHTGKNPFKCDICLKSFSRRSNLNSHLRIHTGDKPFTCDICLKSFTQKRYLNRHLRNHSGENPFKCDICLKSFSSNSYLNSHLRIHTGENPFKCDICLKSFSSSSYLNSHLRTHTEENPFECDICLKSFTQKEGLKRHLRIHTGDKPFKCDICLKSFPRKEYLKTHLHIHTGEEPFKCNICLKSFLRKHHLKRHLGIHTGDKPFKCDMCLKSFSDKSYLKKHIMNSHTE